MMMMMMMMITVSKAAQITRSASHAAGREILIRDSRSCKVAAGLAGDLTRERDYTRGSRESN